MVALPPCALRTMSIRWKQPIKPPLSGSQNSGMPKKKPILIILSASKAFLFFLVLIVLTQCKGTGLPKGDPDNGGLFLPGNSAAAVVADSIGGASNVAV